MQCVIICAGKGTRMRPLTEHTPKPLIEVCGKPLLQHIAEALPDEIDELVLVVGYLQEQIREFCGAEYFGKRVQYAQQENFSGGTGDALMCAKELVQGKFLFLNGDDIYGHESLAMIVKEDSAMFCMHSDTPECFGVIIKNEDGTLKEIIEKPEKPTSDLVNIGGYVLQTEIFDFVTPTSEKLGEVLVTDMVSAYSEKHPIKVVAQDLWIPVGSPEDIQAAEAQLCPK